MHLKVIGFKKIVLGMFLSMPKKNDTFKQEAFTKQRCEIIVVLPWKLTIHQLTQQSNLNFMHMDVYWKPSHREMWLLPSLISHSENASCPFTMRTLVTLGH